MANRRIAKRYASALLSLAGEKRVAMDTAAALELVVEALEREPEFMSLLKHPFIAGGEKERLLNEAFTGKVPSLLMDFLALLLEKKRISELATISQVFGELAREQAGVVRARVCSVVPLAEASREKLTKALAVKLKKDVEIVQEQDPRLLGGATMEVGGTLFDGSIKGQLEQLLEKLADN